MSLHLLPFVITPPLPKTGKHNKFLARSDDDKRLMIIRTHEPEKLYCKSPTIYKHREIREYPDSGFYVYEQDTSLLGPSGFLSWRRVKNLGSHLCFSDSIVRLTRRSALARTLTVETLCLLWKNVPTRRALGVREQTPLIVNDTACSQKKVRMTKASGLTLILGCDESDRQ